MEILFHGSTVRGLKELTPFRRSTPGELKKEDVSESVYATDNPLAAVMFPFPWKSEDGIDIESIDETLKLIVPIKLEARLLQPIVLYRLPAELFTPIAGVSQKIRNFWSQQAVAIVAFEEFPDLPSGIRHFGGLVELI